MSVLMYFIFDICSFLLTSGSLGVVFRKRLFPQKLQATPTLLNPPESHCSVPTGNLAINSQANSSGDPGNINIITQGTLVDLADRVPSETATKGAII